MCRRRVFFTNNVMLSERNTDCLIRHTCMDYLYPVSSSVCCIQNMISLLLIRLNRGKHRLIRLNMGQNVYCGQIRVDKPNCGKNGIFGQLCMCNNDQI